MPVLATAHESPPIRRQASFPLSLTELSPQEGANEHIWTLGIMDLPKLQLLGFEGPVPDKYSRRPPCSGCVTQGQQFIPLLVPVSLPSLTYAVLHNIYSVVASPHQILHSTPALNYLTMRIPVSYVTSNGVSWLSSTSSRSYFPVLQEFGFYVNSCDVRHLEFIMKFRSGYLEKLCISRKMMDGMEAQVCDEERYALEVVKAMEKEGKICVVEEDLIPSYEVEMERMRSHIR